MILCAYCQSQVDDDSFFCDQCGKEIMICTECGRTGQGKCCDEDGSELVSAKSKAGISENISGNKLTDPMQNNPVVQGSDTGSAPESNHSTSPSRNSNQPMPIPVTGNINNNNQTHLNLAAPSLRLVNTNLGLTLDITSGEILGRTTGPYSGKLSGFPGISGKHLVFDFDMNKGWSFRDIGSSNGTRYNKTNTNWQSTAISSINTPVPVENKSYILIANVEFIIQIDSHSNTGTQRL